MGSINRIILTGRLTADPEIRYTKNEKPVAHFSLAVKRNYSKKEGETDVDFVRIIAWNGQAKISEQYLKKGQMVAIEGRLQISSYEKNGEKKSSTEVVADSIEMLSFPASRATEEAPRALVAA